MYPFLKRFVGNWPVNHFLKTHFNNKRAYEKGKGKEKGPKGKPKCMTFKNIAYDDLFNFGTDQEEPTEEDSDEESANDEAD